MNIFSWNPVVHSDQENLQWCWLRSVEWGIWPAFLSIPIVPLLLIYFIWWKVFIAVAIFTVAWSFIRYKYVNVGLASMGVHFVFLKWITTPLVLIYFIGQGNYILAIVSVLYTIFAAYFGVFVGGTKIGVIQKMFMNKLGYSENNL